jgi:hypothetical protein
VQSVTFDRAQLRGPSHRPHRQRHWPSAAPTLSSKSPPRRYNNKTNSDSVDGTNISRRGEPRSNVLRSDLQCGKANHLVLDACAPTHIYGALRDPNKGYVFAGFVCTCFLCDKKSWIVLRACLRASSPLATTPQYQGCLKRATDPYDEVLLVEARHALIHGVVVDRLVVLCHVVSIDDPVAHSENDVTPPVSEIRLRQDEHVDKR